MSSTAALSAWMSVWIFVTVSCNVCTVAFISVWADCIACCNVSTFALISIWADSISSILSVISLRSNTLAIDAPAGEDEQLAAPMGGGGVAAMGGGVVEGEHDAAPGAGEGAAKPGAPYA